MKAVIVAAGAGSRLQGVSPVKPLARVGGTALLDHALENCAAAGAAAAVVVAGHAAEAISGHIAARGRSLPLPVEVVVNDDWPAGNGSSLLAASRAVTGDCVLTMCDHLFDPTIMADLIALRRPAATALILAVDRRLNSDLVDIDDVTKVLAEGSAIRHIGKELSDYNCYDTGLFRLSSEVFTKLAELRARQPLLGISDAVRAFAADGRAAVFDIGQRFWIDVDDANTFAIATRELARRQRRDAKSSLALG